MADRAQLRRMRQALIRAGVADETTTDDELEERASHLLGAIYVFAEAMAPALSMETASNAQIFHRLAEFADVVEKGSGP